MSPRPLRSVLRLPALALCLLTAGCATPLRPSGGPEDRTPPQLTASVPAAGATRVADRRVVLTFSERVDEAAFRRALTVTPTPERAPDVRVRGHEAEVVFDSLRADVTYVLTLGTELRDLHGVALPAPLTLAFATGDRIDRGRLGGLVREPATGRGAAGTAVFAYRLPADTTLRPDPRTATPDYRTQTGTDGTFTLDYLRPGPYFVVAVTDRNRNGRADATEPFAVPPAPVLRAVEPDSAAAEGPPTADRRPPTEAAPTDNRPPGAPPPGQRPPGNRPPGTPSAPVFFLTRTDTTGPEARTVMGRSARVVTVRFDEPVRLDSAAAGDWAVEDSLREGAAAVVTGVWLRPDDAREVYVGVAAAPGGTRPALRLVRAGAVRDSVGNAAAPFARGFTPSAVPDTAQARFAAFLPTVPTAADSALVLRPGERPGVRFTLPLTTDEARARIAVRDPAGAALPYTLENTDAVTLRLLVEAPRFSVAVAVGDTTRTRRFVQPGPDALGAVLGRVEGLDGTVVLEAIPDGPVVRGRPSFIARTGPDGTFSFPTLPPGPYRLRLFADRDGDGAWDGGTLAPYAPPEPLAWLRSTFRVRPRWDTDLGTLRLAAGEAVADGLEEGR